MLENHQEEVEDIIEEQNEEKAEKLAKKPKKKRTIIKVLAFLIIFFGTSFAVFSSQIIISGQSSDSWFANLPIVKQIKHLAESAERKLKGEDEDRINILLLGMGGRFHEGGYLTDTIMLVSLQPSTKKVSMLSIPRDTAIPVEGKGWEKINSINAYAEMEEAGSGGVAMSQAMSDILQTPIDYYVRVDFEGFVNIVDELGGLDVYVENTLSDRQYPIMGREEAEDYESRFEHLYIEKGLQKMDGKLALKYARSRHAIGIEGSDFARAKRQQQVIVAAKEKALSTENLLKPTMITNILEEFKEHVSTNLKIWEIVKLWGMFKDINKTNISNKVLDDGPNGLLVGGRNEKGSYVLRPQSNDFAEIQYMVNNVFSDAPQKTKVKVTKERATVEVRNGTWINGLASKTALDIEKYGFVVIRIGNSNKQNFEKSVIYDLTYGEKMDSLTILKEKTGANISFGLPGWLTDDIKQEIEGEEDPIQPDFILIIGQDADQTKSGLVNTEDEDDQNVTPDEE